MKHFRTLLSVMALALGLFTAAAQNTVTYSPYTVACESYAEYANTEDDGGPTFILSSGWSFEYGSSMYARYSIKEGVGIDGTNCVGIEYNSTSTSVYLVTPEVSGTVSFYAKSTATSSWNTPEIKFYTVEARDNGKWTVASDTLETDLVALSNSEWTKVTVTGVESQRLAIRGAYVLLDNFEATSAVVELKTALKVVSATTLSPTTADCDADGNYNVKLAGRIANTGDVTIVAGSEGASYSIGQYVSSSVPHVTIASKPFEQDLAPGDTIDVEIEATLNYSEYSARKRYDLVENVTGTYAYGSWVEPVPYAPVIKVTNMNGNELEGSYATTFGAFGMISEPTSKQFVVRNDGAAPMNATVTVPAGFTVDRAAFTVAAHERDTLTLTASNEIMGINSGDMVISAEGTETTYTVAVSATVLDPSKYFEPFTNNADVTALPTGWYDPDDKWSKTNFTNGANNFVRASLVDEHLLVSPLLKVTEGEKMQIDVAKMSSYSSEANMKVYYSADRKSWTLARAIENSELSGLVASNSSTASNKFGSFVIEGIPAGNYYIAFGAGYCALDNVYGFELVPVEHDVVLAAQNIPANGTVNSEYFAAASVKNLNTADETGYTATLYFNGEAVSVAETETLGSNQTKDFEFSFTPHQDGTFPAYVKFDFNGFELVTDTVQVVVAQEQAVGQVTVGEQQGPNDNSTSYAVPVVPYYKHSKSYTVYTQAMLEAAGIKNGDVISGVSYKGFNSNGEYTAAVRVLMANVEDVTFEENATNDFPAYDTMTEMFSGDYTYPNEGTFSAMVEMLDIDFSAPFVYTGGAIAIMVTNTSDSYKRISFGYDNSIRYQAFGNRADGGTLESLTSGTTYAVFPLTTFKLAMTPAQFSGKVVDKHGAAVAGATVVLDQVQVSEEDGDVTEPEGAPAKVAQVQYSAVTDENGEFVMDVIQSSLTYNMTVSAEGYKTAQVADVDLTQLANVTLEKAEQGVVVNVANGEGAPIADAAVTFTNVADPDDVITGTTDANGQVTVTVEAGESYTVAITATGYQDYTDAFDAPLTSDEQEANYVMLEIVPTGVSDINAATRDSNVYSLDGRVVVRNAASLEGLSQGIYIYKGRKVIVK